MMQAWMLACWWMLGSYEGQHLQARQYACQGLISIVVWCKCCVILEASASF
jgi:hypothetical protein